MTWEVTEDSPVLKPRRGILRKGMTGEVLASRVSADDVRQLQEIVASRVDPRLKTISDCVRDAIVDWLEKFYIEADMVEMELFNTFQRTRIEEQFYIKTERIERNEQLFHGFDTQLKQAKFNRDEERLTELKAQAVTLSTVCGNENFRDQLLKLVEEY